MCYPGGGLSVDEYTQHFIPGWWRYIKSIMKRIPENEDHRSELQKKKSHTRATSGRLLTSPSLSHQLSYSSSHTIHLLVIISASYILFTHPPIAWTISGVEPKSMGFIHPHPHQVIALRRSSSRPTFTPHILTTVVNYLCREHEDNTPDIITKRTRRDRTKK